MCGIAGIWRSPSSEHDYESDVRRMANALQHRGPDHYGSWIDGSRGIALAHRRLSILDLSSAGNQPMRSPSGRYIISLNGEIYNHRELRHAIDASDIPVSWRSHSDTETLLGAFDLWGIDEAIRRAVGMYAIAVWDCREQVLSLVRDRIGEKPLYYGWTRTAFVFASELKAIAALQEFPRTIDRDALALFVRLGYVPAPRSIYAGIHKLSAGYVLKLNYRGAKAAPWSRVLPAASFDSDGFSLTRYWSLADCEREGRASPLADADEAGSQLEKLLAQTISNQMLADVPLGALLSGGIDSSAVAAFMQIQSARPIRTFTIGFHEQGYNEAEHARHIARHLGTEHTELYVTPSDGLSVVPQLASLYDEPLADASQIPAFLVAKLARQNVTVALTGDGGDEVFGGYNRHVWASSIWRHLKLWPSPARSKAAAAIRVLSPLTWDRLGALVTATKQSRLPLTRLGDKATKLARMIESDTLIGAYRNLTSSWSGDAAIVLDSDDPFRESTTEDFASVTPLEHQLMLLDAATYLPDDVLVKVDRAAMGVGLETRAPFLDHRVIEFAYRLPLSLKIRGGKGKWILRRILEKYIPPNLVNRPKMGFTVPIAEWLRGPLSQWADSLLDERKISSEGYLDAALVRKKWREHSSARVDWSQDLWNVLMFEVWLDHWCAPGRR